MPTKDPAQADPTQTATPFNTLVIFQRVTQCLDFKEVTKAKRINKTAQDAINNYLGASGLLQPKVQFSGSALRLFLSDPFSRNERYFLFRVSNPESTQCPESMLNHDSILPDNLKRHFDVLRRHACHAQCSASCGDEIRRVLEAAASTSPQHAHYALSWAAFFGHTDVVQALVVRYGQFDPNFSKEALAVWQHFPLLSAVSKNYTQVIRALLPLYQRSGPDFVKASLVASDQSAPTIAASNGNVEAVTSLLDLYRSCGPDCLRAALATERSIFSHSVLRAAAENGYAQMVMLLLTHYKQFGVAFIREGLAANNHAALYKAEYNQHTDVVQLLRECYTQCGSVWLEAASTCRMLSARANRIVDNGMKAVGSASRPAGKFFDNNMQVVADTLRRTRRSMGL